MTYIRTEFELTTINGDEAMRVILASITPSNGSKKTDTTNKQRIAKSMNEERR